MFKKINWRYAFGEIIIVIIGITIAFALNKYAENARNKSTQRKYLTSLINDLDNEIIQLEANMEKFDEKMGNIRQIFPYFSGKQEGRDTIAPKIFNMAQIVHFYPNDITYKTLINSGDLELFDDFELKKSLENHYSDQIFLQNDYDRQKNIHENYFGAFMIYNMDYDKMRQGDYSFIDDKTLQNIIQSLYGTYMIAITSSKSGIERCREMKGILEGEL